MLKKCWTHAPFLLLAARRNMSVGSMALLRGTIPSLSARHCSSVPEPPQSSLDSVIRSVVLKRGASTRQGREFAEFLEQLECALYDGLRGDAGALQPHLLSIALPAAYKARHQAKVPLTEGLKAGLSEWVERCYGSLDAADIPTVLIYVARLRLCSQKTAQELMVRALDSGPLRSVDSLNHLIDLLVATAAVCRRVGQRRAPAALPKLLGRIRSGGALTPMQHVAVIRALGLISPDDPTQTSRLYMRHVTPHIRTLPTHQLLDCLLAAALCVSLEPDFVVACLEAVNERCAALKPAELAEACDYILRLTRRELTMSGFEVISHTVRRLLPVITSAASAHAGCFRQSEADVILSCLTSNNVRHGLLVAKLVCPSA